MMYQKLIVPVDNGNPNMITENTVFTSGLVESDCKPVLGDYLYNKKRYYSLTDQRIPYMRDSVVIADLGGFTFDYLLLRSGKPDLSVCDSLEKGIIRLHNNIISRINSEYDVLLESSDIDRIIKNEKTDYEEAVVRTVREMTKTYVDDLLGNLRERGIDLKSVCIVFIGGGALLLKEYLENSGKLGKYIFIEDVCANAKGYKMLY